MLSQTATGKESSMVAGRRTQLLQGRAELVKERVEEVGYAVKPPVEARTTEHAWHQPRLSEEGAAALDVAAEVEGRNKRGGDDFRVRQLAPTVVFVADGLEQIIHNAVECGRVIDHRSPPVFVWRRDGGDFPLLSKNWSKLN